MSFVLYALDREDADRTGPRLIVHAAGWETATPADLAPHLTVLSREDAIETLAPAIATMRETEAAEAAEAGELERWLRAGGSRYVGFELDAALAGVVARSAIREPAIVLGTPLRPGDEHPISDTAIMHGACAGELLAIARWNGIVELWSLPDRRRRAAFSPAPSAEDTEDLIDGLAFDHELGILATSAHHGEELAGFKADGKRLWKRKVTNGNRGHLAFANGTLLWWCRDRAAVLEPNRGKPVFEIEPGEGIAAAAIDGTSVVVAFHDGLVRRYPVAGGAPLREVRVASPAHVVLAGERIAIASRYDVTVVEADGTSRTVTLDREAVLAATGCAAPASDEWDHRIESIAVLADGTVAIGDSVELAGTRLGAVAVVDPASGSVTMLGGPGTRHCGRLLEVLGTPDGGVLSRDGHAIRLWDPKTNTLRATFSGGTRKLAGMCLAHGHLWAWSSDGAIYGWELSAY